MYFIDNKTDRMILNYITKSMNSEDIEKSLDKSGLVQVERMVIKPGVTPFRQKFWVKLDEVKKTDVVLHGSVPQKKIDKENVFQSSQIKNTSNKEKSQIKENISSKSQLKIPIIDKDSTLSDEDQRLLESATLEQQIAYKALGVCGGNEGGADFLVRYKTKLDNNFKQLQRMSPLFSQKALNEAKQSMYENFGSCLIAESLYVDEILGNSPDEFLKNYRDNIVSVLDTDSEDTLYAPFVKAVQRWKDNVKLGKISKDDPDVFFEYARESILQNNLDNPSFNFGTFSEVYGVNLYRFVPKDFIGKITEPVYPDKTIKAKVTSLSTDSLEYKQLADDYTQHYISEIAIYNKKTNAFESDILGNNYKIKNIYKIEGLAGELEFQQIKNKNVKYKDKNYGGKNGYVDKFYHGTPLNTSFTILGDSGKFKQGIQENGAAFGTGLYVTDDITTAFKYMVKHDVYDLTASSMSRPEGIGTNYTGCVMVCEGSLGNCEFGTHVHDLSKEYIHTKLDSVGVPPIDWPNKEWKFNNPGAVIPRYFIEVEVTPKEK